MNITVLFVGRSVCDPIIFQGFRVIALKRRVGTYQREKHLHNSFISLHLFHRRYIHLMAFQSNLTILHLTKYN